MTLSDFYNLINVFCMSAGVGLLLIRYITYVDIKDLLFFIAFLAVLTIFSAWLDFAIVANIAALFFALYSISHPVLRSCSPISSLRSLNLATKLFFLVLVIVPFVLSGRIGWESVLSASFELWFMFGIVRIYSISNNGKTKNYCALIMLFVGVVLLSKLIILMGVVMLFFEFVSNFSTKKLLFIFFEVVLVLCFIYLVWFQKFKEYLELSVFRPDYLHDTKVLGFSDGGRIDLWLSYLKNSQWIGHGIAPEAEAEGIPTHNIFVYLAYEGGILVLLFLGAIFTALMIKMFFVGEVMMSILVLIVFNISSIAEYGSLWAVCVVLFPMFLGSNLSRNFNTKVRQFKVHVSQ